jgi:hypothetical protein
MKYGEGSDQKTHGSECGKPILHINLEMLFKHYIPQEFPEDILFIKSARNASGISVIATLLGYE